MASQRDGRAPTVFLSIIDPTVLVERERERRGREGGRERRERGGVGREGEREEGRKGEAEGVGEYMWKEGVEERKRKLLRRKAERER